MSRLSFLITGRSLAFQGTRFFLFGGALAIATATVLATAAVGFAYGPGNESCVPNVWDGAARPAYHITDDSCEIGDPNGPFYANGTYHLFYQRKMPL